MFLTPGRICPAQDAVNALLQLYLVHLIDSGQHALLPLYACHLRADVRHEVFPMLALLPRTLHDCPNRTACCWVACEPPSDAGHLCCRVKVWEGKSYRVL